MMVVTIEPIFYGRHPQEFCDAQIEKGKIIPTDTMEFKNQKTAIFNKYPPILRYDNKRTLEL